MVKNDASEKAGYDLYAMILPAKETGGDFYDFFPAGKGILGVVIADVSGKGAPAAELMEITKMLIRDNACSGRAPGKSPKEIFETVNTALCERAGADMFVTAFMGYYHIANGRFVFVNAGHTHPLVKKCGGEYGFLKIKPNIVLAWSNETVYEEEEITLEGGSSLFLYTDGITEAKNLNREMFSGTRLLAALNKNKESPPKDLLPAVKNEVDIFTTGAGQSDDIAMLALRINKK